jgi:hypothetical protein
MRHVGCVSSRDSRELSEKWICTCCCDAGRISATPAQVKGCVSFFNPPQCVLFYGAESVVSLVSLGLLVKEECADENEEISVSDNRVVPDDGSVVWSCVRG